MIKFLRRSALLLSRTFLSVAVLLLCFQRLLIYHPRDYDAAFVESRHAEALRYTTSQGEQVGWLRNVDKPGAVWLVFAGNGTRALDLIDYFGGQEALERDAFVHVDYPGYGSSAGRVTPETMRESIVALLPALAQRLKTTPEALRPRLRVFGHSLGSAAALIAMGEHHVSRGVLIAPFDAMRSMAKQVVGWPLCELLHHRYDNDGQLRLLQQRGGAKLEVIHGTADEVIPQSQSARLAQTFPDLIAYQAVPGARHNTILYSDRERIIAAMARVGGD